MPPWTEQTEIYSALDSMKLVKLYKMTFKAQANGGTLNRFWKTGKLRMESKTAGNLSVVARQILQWKCWRLYFDLPLQHGGEKKSDFFKQRVCEVIVSPCRDSKICWNMQMTRFTSFFMDRPIHKKGLVQDRGGHWNRDPIGPIKMIRLVQRTGWDWSENHWLEWVSNQPFKNKQQTSLVVTRNSWV